MGVSAESLPAPAREWVPELAGAPVARSISRTARSYFLVWAAVFWGGVCAALLFTGVLDFTSS